MSNRITEIPEKNFKKDQSATRRADPFSLSKSLRFRQMTEAAPSRKPPNTIALLHF